jgi:hypothetical protein
MDYDAALEASLCPDDDLRERLQAYRANCSKSKVRRVVSSRFVKEAYAAKLAGLSDEEVDEALFGGWTPDEISKAKAGVNIRKAVAHAAGQIILPNPSIKLEVAWGKGVSREEFSTKNYSKCVKVTYKLPEGWAACREVVGSGVTVARNEMTRQTVEISNPDGDSGGVTELLDHSHDRTPDGAPSCPKHGSMVRMTSGKGWRCNAFGNKYQDGRWTVCDYCVFDK